ncbi:MAG TPA: NADH-quinone oxidoreductase subunit C [Cytophagales bacterium]|nr:NADH-quinone oxidoreductase subunit C [Cytophagales bacterium]
MENNTIVEKLQSVFGKAIILVEEPHGFLTITADKTKNLDILKYLWEDKDLEFRFLTDICGIHYPSQELELGVIYHLHSLRNNVRIRLKFFMSIEDPSIDSATVMYASANWMERETYDFFGIIFNGHPDLRRILNMDELTVFPMRKEYPLEDPNRVDKKDYYFGR